MRCLFSLILGLTIIAADAMDLQFMHLTTDDGLAHNHVNCILADRNGMMWFGTRNGVCRYDGYSMNVYTQSKGDTEGLPNNFISSVFQDSEGRIWVGSDKGAVRYTPLTDSFSLCEGIDGMVVTSFAENSDGTVFCAAAGNLYRLAGDNRFEPVTYGLNNHPITPVNVIAVDHNDNLWIGARNGLTSYDPTFTTRNHITDPDADINDVKNKILDLFVDKDNNIWAGRNGGGVVCLRQKEMNVRTYTVADGLANNVVRAVSQDDHGRIWFGTEGGISLMDSDGHLDNIRQEFANRFSLNDNAIYEIVRDNNGNMWIGTYFGGLNIFLKDYEAFTYYIAGDQRNQLKGKAVRQMVEQEDGTLWIATEDGGLNRMNQSTGEIVKLDLPCLKSDNVHSLAIVGNDLWIGSFIDGLTRYDLSTHKAVNYNTLNSGLPNNDVFALYYDGTHLWIGTALGLCRFDSESGKIMRVDADILRGGFVYHLTGDQHGNLWCGMRNNGLICYNMKTGLQKCWTAQIGNNNLSDDYVTFVFNDSHDDMYVGTNNGGLYRYNRDTDDFYSFLDENVFTEQCICGLVEDDNGNIWITTNHGLFMYDKGRMSVSKFRMADLMSISHFNYASTFRNSQGRLFLGSVNGMISFFPDDMSASVIYPDVFVRSVTIGGNRIIPAGSDVPVTISYDEAGLFTIEYAGINAAVSGLIEYSIMMDGLNSSWTDMGAQRSIVFSHLKAGEYTFCVRATSDPGHWSDDNITRLRIVVKPPYYATWWAFVIYALAVCGVGYGIYWYIRRLWRKKQNAEEERREIEQADALVAMKNDFFSNITHEFRTPLSLIIAPVQQMLKNRSLPAEMRDNLQLILRNSNSLMTIVNDLISFNKSDMMQEINLRRGNPFVFIADLASRFEPLAESDGVEFVCDIEEWDEEVYYSRTVVRAVTNNLLSNALKYTGAGGKVRLSAQYVSGDSGGRFLEITVADTGCGIAGELHDRIFDKYYQANASDGKRMGWGIGLALVRNLVVLHKGTISVDSEPGKGSVFTVRLNVSADAFSAERLITDDKKYPAPVTYQPAMPQGKASDRDTENATPESERNVALIVEDNPDMLQYLTRLFEDNDYSVMTAVNGDAALESISGDRLPDIIVSDVMMPGIDGTELCRRIKSDLLTVHIPVILLTAKVGTQNSLKGFEFGADAYVEKPFDPSALLYQVRNIMRMRDSNRKRFNESQAPDIEIMANNKYDRKLLKDIKEVVEANIGNSEFCINDILKAVGVSRTMLHVKLKSLLNMSIGDYIREMRISKAKEMLRSGESISDTAYATGFADPNYFSKCFKKKEGVTPSEFIKNNQQSKTEEPA